MIPFQDEMVGCELAFFKAPQYLAKKPWIQDMDQANHKDQKLDLCPQIRVTPL